LPVDAAVISICIDLTCISGAYVFREKIWGNVRLMPHA